jgi:hypothetical protein
MNNLKGGLMGKFKANQHWERERRRLRRMEISVKQIYNPSDRNDKVACVNIVISQTSTEIFPRDVALLNDVSKMSDN